jgi:hypothetical protein
VQPAPSEATTSGTMFLPPLFGGDDVCQRHRGVLPAVRCEYADAIRVESSHREADAGRGGGVQPLQVRWRGRPASRRRALAARRVGRARSRGARQAPPPSRSEASRRRARVFAATAVPQTPTAVGRRASRRAPRTVVAFRSRSDGTTGRGNRAHGRALRRPTRRSSCRCPRRPRARAPPDRLRRRRETPGRAQARPLGRSDATFRLEHRHVCILIRGRAFVKIGCR